MPENLEKTLRKCIGQSVFRCGCSDKCNKPRLPPGVKLNGKHLAKFCETLAFDTLKDDGWDVFWPQKFKNKVIVGAPDLLSRWKVDKPLLSWLLQLSESEKLKDRESDTSTSDLIIVGDDSIIGGDVKALSVNSYSSNNFISCDKMCSLTEIIINGKNDGNVKISHIGILWENEIDYYICKDVLVVDMFRECPSRFKINNKSSWQVQTSLNVWTQDYNKTPIEWCKEWHQCHKEKIDLWKKEKKN